MSYMTSTITLATPNPSPVTRIMTRYQPTSASGLPDT